MKYWMEYGLSIIGIKVYGLALEICTGKESNLFLFVQKPEVYF